MKFNDLTSDQISRNNAAIELPKYAINHLTITRVTDKAICVQVDKSSWVHKSVIDVWLPISQINVIKTYKVKNFVDSDINNDKENRWYFQVDIPEWILRKNKII